MWPVRLIKHLFGPTWRGGLLRLAVAVTVMAALGSLVASLLALASSPGSRGVMYLALINFNLVLIALFIIYMGRRFLLLFLDRKSGLVGARLHVRLLGIFSFMAVLPALVVAVFSVVFLNLGIEAWFSNRVTSALDGSLEVAQAYFEEHGNRLLTEAKSLARDPTISDPTFLIDPESIEEALRQERKARNLAEVTVYSSKGKLIAHAGDLAPTVSQELLEVLNEPGFTARLFADYKEGRIVAVAAINPDAYLVLTRWIAPAVLNHMDRTREAYQEYYELRSERGRVRIMFTLFFAVTTTIVLAGAIWAGLSLASRIVRPVTDLVHASNRVREGDLNVQVEVIDDDEIGALATAFNQMTASMAENQSLLESKNRELDERRRTMEAVLTGVSAGVMSVDFKGIVRLANKTARETLGVRAGGRLSTYNAELGEMFQQFVDGESEVSARQLKHLDDEGVKRTLLVRMVGQDTIGRGIRSVVVTFDDITALLSAQRVAAWADVARRLAHEIKNPLTPIQLSAERLQRKYGHEIQTDNTIFKSLTQTIVHQVEEMRQMLNEFSDFARMPAAVFGVVDINALLDEMILLQKEAHPDIEFSYKPASGRPSLEGDAAHLRRMFINLLENAINAVTENEAIKQQGVIKIVVERTQGGKIAIMIEDNGPGFAHTVELEQLFDPYVTTRKKGTGLGLAIVRKVVDEHAGQIRLYRVSSRGGARVEIIFPQADEEAI